MMVGEEVDYVPPSMIANVLTSSYYSASRKGFQLSEQLCGLVDDTPQLGECASFSSKEKKHLMGENGVLENYFPYKVRVEKTEVKSDRPNARVKQVEFIKMYGCSNSQKTGCKCALWTARAPGVILVYERVDAEGTPFKHIHEGIDMETGLPVATTDIVEASLPIDALPTSATNTVEAPHCPTPPRGAHQSAALKQPNPSGSPSGTLRRAKNAKRSELSTAGNVSDIPQSTNGGDETTSSPEDILLQALFAKEGNAPVLHDTITEGTQFNGPHELFSFVLNLFVSTGMKKSNLGKQNKRSMTPEELEKTPWGNCVFIDPRDERKSEIPSRGMLFCKHREYGWCVPFSYLKKCQVYEVRSGKDTNTSYRNHLCLEHNHPPDMEDADVHGYIEIKNKNDLTVAELEMLRVCARLHSKMPTIQHALSVAFGKKDKRLYSSDLIRREVDRFKKEIFGTDEHRMKELIEMGNQAKRNGGCFDIDVSSTMTLVGTRFQTSLMRQYAESRTNVR